MQQGAGADPPSWYYASASGQIGPLDASDIGDLIRAGAVTRQTPIWRSPMPQWVPAGSISDFMGDFIAASALSPDMAVLPPPAYSPRGAGQPYAYSPYGYGAGPQAMMPSNKNRLVAAGLNLIPGVGRIYLGYTTTGILQLLLFVFCFVGLIWAWIDALLIACGKPKTDADGRQLVS